MRRTYSSRQTEKEDVIQKQSIRFQQLFHNNTATESEILGINLYRAYHENKLKRKDNTVLAKLIDILRTPIGDQKILNPNDADSIQELLATNKRVRRYLMLFKDECPVTLKKIIFAHELDKCYKDALSNEKKLLIKRLQNCLAQGQQCSFTEAELAFLNTARTGRCLAHFKSEWDKSVIIETIDSSNSSENDIEMSKTIHLGTNLDDIPVQSENFLDTSRPDFQEHDKQAGNIALFIYKEDKGILASFTRIFTHKYQTKDLTNGEQSAYAFTRRYINTRTFDKLLPSPNDASSYAFIEALSNGTLGKIRNAYLPNNQAIIQKEFELHGASKFKTHLEAHQREERRLEEQMQRHMDAAAIGPPGFVS